MPGYEVINNSEFKEISDVFKKSKVLFRMGFEKLRRGIYKVKKFETSFSRFMGVKYSLGVTSGTAALRVALSSLNLKPGDEVITQSFTFVATVESIIEARAIPVCTEIDQTLNMDPNDFIAALTKWRDLFVSGKDLPVFGVTEAELNSMKMPVIIIPGNDKIHDSRAGRIVNEMIPGSKLHQLPIEDQDLDLVPFEEWTPHEPEITSVFTEFMSNH